jgi:ABC-type transporter Mla subunit MlaD
MMNKVSDFSKLLDEMREHTKRSLVDAQTQPFTPSTPELQTLLATAKENSNRINFSSVDDIIGQLKNAAYQDAVTVAKDVKKKVEGAWLTYQQDKDVDEFIDNMEKASDYANQDVGGQIDSLTDQATTLGQQHPEAQEAILQFLTPTLELFHRLFGRINDFLDNAAMTAASWLVQAEEEIYAFFNSLNGWISQNFN